MIIMSSIQRHQNVPGKPANNDFCPLLRMECSDLQKPRTPLFDSTTHLKKKRKSLSYTRKSKALEYDLQKLNWQGMWQ